jgi:hypothetical protein
LIDAYVLFKLLQKFYFVVISVLFVEIVDDFSFICFLFEMDIVLSLLSGYTRVVYFFSPGHLSLSAVFFSKRTAGSTGSLNTKLDPTIT